MKIVCAPKGFDFSAAKSDLAVLLYDRTNDKLLGSAGAAILEEITKKKLNPDPRAWDFLSIALSVISADLAGHRSQSPDGWTREFDLHISVADQPFWESQKETLEQALRFLTTDIWKLHFSDQGLMPNCPVKPSYLEEDCVVLLSGGLDSFVGVLDLTANGKKPVAVSQSVRGDAEKQREMATTIGKGLYHLQLNHNADIPGAEEPPSQRARSMIFFAYGVLAATTLASYSAGKEVVLYVCENGFITINPPLTDLRVGSLSTRTCHPVFLSLLQKVLSSAGLRVRIESPYRLKTKGEMLSECSNQPLLLTTAYRTTSCGRFKRFGYKHCGRCVPCLIRRSAFHASGIADETIYVHADLSINDKDHGRFDDVQSVTMALMNVSEDEIDRWLGPTLSSPLILDPSQVKEVIKRGLNELEAFLDSFQKK